MKDLSFRADTIRYKGENRTTTVNSLMAVCYLLTAKTKEEFAKYYLEATHDDSGIATWSAMDLDGKAKARRNAKSKEIYHRKQSLKKLRGTK